MRVSARAQRRPCASQRLRGPTAVHRQRGLRRLVAADAGQSILVDRQPYLDLPRDRVWDLVRRLVPEAEWPATARVLAMVEAVYKVEFQQHCEGAAGTLEAVNSALVLPDRPPQPPEHQRRRQRRRQQAQDAAAQDTAAERPTAPTVTGSASDSDDFATTTDGAGTLMSTADAGDQAVAARDVSASSNGARAAVDLPHGGAAGTEGQHAVATAPLSQQNGSAGAHDSSRQLLETRGGSASAVAAPERQTASVAAAATGGVVAPTLRDPGASAPARDVRRSALATADVVGDSSARHRSSAEGGAALALAGGAPSEARPDRGHRNGASAAQAEERGAGEGETSADAGGEDLRGAPPAADGVYNSDSYDSDSSTPELGDAALVRFAREGGVLSRGQAAALDQMFMRQLLFLAERAHFSGLRPRDVALANSLNSDQLSQLFVKVDPSTLDPELTASFSDPNLPTEAKALFMMTRGVGTEVRNGRLLVPKLDYLQLLAVRWVREAVQGLVQMFWEAWNTTIDGEGPGKAASIAPQDRRTVDYGDEMQQQVLEDLSAQGKDAMVSLSEWGLSPRLVSVGGGVIMTLSDWGFLPKVNVIPLSKFDKIWKVTDDRPASVKRVTLEHVFESSASEPLLRRFFSEASLQEPTFAELLVVSRRKKTMSKLEQLQRRILSHEDDEADAVAVKREPVSLKVLEEVPMAYWQVVFPDKLLQFRPLDGLRLDLVTLAGVVAVLAQAKFTSVLLEIVSFASMIVLVVRTVLGYQRMFQRYESFVNDLLASKLIAAQDGAVLQFLAVSAANQQFAQAALSYALLTRRAALARADVAALAAAEEAALRADANGDEDGVTVARRAQAPLLEGWLRPWLDGSNDVQQPPAPAARAAAGSQKSGDATDGEATAGELEDRARALLAEVLGSGRRLLSELRSRLQGSPVQGDGAPGMTAESLQAEAESVLNAELPMPVRFSAAEALGELARFQLLQGEAGAVRAWLQDARPSGAEGAGSPGGASTPRPSQPVWKPFAWRVNAAARRPVEGKEPAARGAQPLGDGHAAQEAPQPAESVALSTAEVAAGARVVAVTPHEAHQRLSRHWDSLLESSANALLRTVL